MDRVWEDLVTLNTQTEQKFEILSPASEYFDPKNAAARWADLPLQKHLNADRDALPATRDREGYYGEDHFGYWASGLQDARNLLSAADEFGVDVKASLDLGCASGRVIRHLGASGRNIEVIGCDINKLHVDWCNRFLASCLVFQNHSIPNLPLQDNSVDLVSAFSVFTHIEAMETAWLMELRRVMRPGGIAWITVHTEHTLAEMDESWPLWKAVMNHPQLGPKLKESREMEQDRLVARWKNDRSYSSNVFYKSDVLMRRWGKVFDVVDFRRRCPQFQDVIILRKR